MFGYKYHYYFVKGDTVELEQETLKLSAPAQRGDIIQVVPRSQQNLPIGQQIMHQLVVVTVTHQVGGVSFLKLKKAVNEDFV